MSLPSSTALVLVSSLLLLSLASSTFADGNLPSTPIVIPITKDHSTSTPLYTIPGKNGGSLVLDLAGNLIWSTCPEYSQIPCRSTVCKVASRHRPASCGPPTGGQHGSTDPRCTCTGYAYNPVSGNCGNGDLAVVPFSGNATDGSHPLFPVSFRAYQTCAPDGLLESLPSGAAGIAGLSRQPLSLPSQVAAKLKVAKQFALCLPSEGNTGAAIFGGGPFVLQSQDPGDLAAELRQSSLPLLKNPKNDAYYFRVHGIAVNQRLVPLAPDALDLNLRTGGGGAAFSTVTPYTTLRSDIFGALMTVIEKLTNGTPRVKPPPPLFLCFEKSEFGQNRLGPTIFNIDFMLDNGQNWTLPGGSSLVQVGPETLCFAFENMGSPASEAPDSPAIIFGTHQMQDNLVQFDLEKSTFGFSGLLLGRRTHCGNFNFNSGKR